MAKLVFGMNLSLDGYVDHTAFAPSPALFRHFVGEAEAQAGSIYGGRMYEVMRYWDEEHPDWSADERAFAQAGRRQPKWVVSRTFRAVGPNATPIGDDLAGAVGAVKAGRAGEIEVAGPLLAHCLGELGLIDEYRIYLHPVVLGQGKPYFAGPRPPAAAAPDGARCDRRRCDPADLRPGVSARRTHRRSRGEGASRPVSRVL